MILIFSSGVCSNDARYAYSIRTPPLSVSQDIQLAKDACDKIRTYYRDGLTEENKRTRELYFGFNTFNSLLEKASNFNPNIHKPSTADYSALWNLTKYRNLTREFATYSDLPIEMTAAEYAAFKSLNYHSSYLAICSEVTSKF